LSDPGNAVARSHGPVFALRVDDRELHNSVGTELAASNSDDGWELPAAAVFIVDADGIIASPPPRDTEQSTRAPLAERTRASGAERTRASGISYLAIMTGRSRWHPAPANKSLLSRLSNRSTIDARSRDTCFGRATLHHEVAPCGTRFARIPRLTLTIASAFETSRTARSEWREDVA
jgi:hypothetical protein